MTKFIKPEKIDLKGNPQIKEDLIQNFISNDPSVLGLGELSLIQREKTQPSGGRLDILLGDDNGCRYEVEVQLGATDPSHIIRTLEYWDTEKKRYPNYDHCAVIVAEEITGRFMNVISLFNGAIPLIALQMNAYEAPDGIMITFTKVLDRISPVNEDEEQFQPTDRAYWENRSTPKMLKTVDSIFESMSEFIKGYDLKYNKFYIGMAKDGVAKNFLEFKPKKNFIYVVPKGLEDKEIIAAFDEAGIDINYIARWKEYLIKIKNLEEYKKHKELIDNLVKKSMEYYSVDDEQ